MKRAVKPLLILVILFLTNGCSDSENGAVHWDGSCTGAFTNLYWDTMAKASTGYDAASIADAQNACNNFFAQFPDVSCTVPDTSQYCVACTTDPTTGLQNCDCTDSTTTLASSDLTPVCQSLPLPN